MSLLGPCLSGCTKKNAPTPPPVSGPSQPVPPETVNAPPALTVRVEPDVIRPGESANLTWETQNAETVVIGQGIGEVDASGRMKLFPDHTSSYRVIASGAGGVTEKTVTVQVTTEEPPVAQDNELAGKSSEEKFAYFVKPVFFDYDSSELKEAAKLTLDGNIRWLLLPENLHLAISLEGHTDDRGTAEYNLALGDRRAQVVREYLIAHGVDNTRLTAFSLGEETPFDPRRRKKHTP